MKKLKELENLEIGKEYHIFGVTVEGDEVNIKATLLQKEQDSCVFEKDNQKYIFEEDCFALVPSICFTVGDLCKILQEKPADLPIRIELLDEYSANLMGTTFGQGLRVEEEYGMVMLTSEGNAYHDLI